MLNEEKVGKVLELIQKSKLESSKQKEVYGMMFPLLELDIRKKKKPCMMMTSYSIETKVRMLEVCKRKKL